MFFLTIVIGLKIVQNMFFGTSGLVKKKAGTWSPLAFFYPRRVVSYRWSKNNILASLCLASYLAANWLQKVKMKHCLLHRSYFCSYACVFVLVCVVSQFDLFITKQNYLFVRCQSLSHISNTSLQCSNQSLWKLNLMTGGKHNKTTDGGD